MNRRIPIVTLLLIAVALVIAAWPDARLALIYDRDAILAGEIWRLFTGHLVHLSIRHLAFDLIGFGVAGCMIEARRMPSFGWLCGVVPCLSSGLMLWLNPTMSQYAGLSGLALAAWVYLGLSSLSAQSSRWLGGLVLLAVTVKLAGEICFGLGIVSGHSLEDIRVATTSHIAGAVSAGLFHLTLRPRLLREVALLA